jgi:hypothetical protein
MNYNGTNYTTAGIQTALTPILPAGATVASEWGAACPVGVGGTN